MSLSRQLDRQTERVSTLALHWSSDRADAPLASPQGGAKRKLPITGQPYTFSRAVAGASLTGSDGASVPAPVRDQPVYSAVDLDGDSVRERLALRLTSADVFDIDIAFGPEALGIYLEVVAGTAVLFYSLGDQTAPHLTIDSPTAGNYRVTHNNGVDAAVSVTTSAAATAGDRVQIWATLNADGSLTLWRRYANGTWTDEGTSAAPASGIASTWGADVAALGTAGNDDFLAAKADIGPVHDETTIEGAY